MLNNIFLFIGKNFQDLDHLNIYNYPNDAITIQDADLVSKIIYGHDHGDLIHKTKINSSQDPQKYDNIYKNHHYKIDRPVPQVIDGLNIYTSCVNNKVIIGLIFNEDDNPYDYKDVFVELLNELLNIENACAFEDEVEIENLLITIFIDIRRFGDEHIDKKPTIEYHYEESFIKVFLFGIDDVGKTSLVRRLKTGQYNDNYFIPTKKFNIDYVKQDNVPWLLAFWDMPGQRAFRKKWLIGLQDSNIIIYMIDIANQIRFKEAKKEFWKIINRYDIADIPILVLANKFDLLSNPAQDEKEQRKRLQNELVSYFEFDKIKNRPWKLIFTSVKTKYNIDLVIKSIFDLL
ncbi:MAG: GTP-binding protein [Promethearchaeota archaeon]|nr:MAG: GTP-binding protein [Candidatus Lokiarchaeota archaeon]